MCGLANSNRATEAMCGGARVRIGHGRIRNERGCSHRSLFPFVSLPPPPPPPPLSVALPHRTAFEIEKGGGGGSPLAPTATATTPLLWSTLIPHRRMITIKGRKRYLRSSGFLLSIVFSDATCDIFLPLLCWLARWEGLDRRGRPSALEHRPSPPPPCP